ncbi:MAG: sodium/solute symporter [Pseudomonadota bacterium]
MEFAYGQPIDYIIVLIYFVVVLGFGALFGKGTRTTKDFFFSGQRFSWWIIAFSCVATVVGSYSFIKYSAAGYRYGLSSSMTYLNDWFLLPLFMLGWLPIIYFSRVQSIPEYFERRFDRPTRVMAVIFIMLYMVGYIGINLYTLGVAMHAIVPGIGTFQWAAIISLVAAFYVTFGGQTAVIMTDLLQGFLLLAAGILLFVLGILYLGEHNGQGLSGLSAFWEGLPKEHRMPFSGFSDPDFPMTGIMWQDLFGSSMFFYFANQGLIMRFLAVKSVAEGRKAIIVVSLFLMPLAVLAVGNSGWIGRAMETYGLLPAGTEPKNIFMAVADLISTPGVFGLILAALTAALMSTVDTLINAVSAITVNDIYRPFISPNRTDKHYLNVARISSVLFTILGLALVPVFMGFDSIYQAHGAFTAAISPPIIVVVMYAILWKRFSARAAFVTLLGGGLLVVLSLWVDALVQPFMDLHGISGAGALRFMRALFGFVACGLLGAITAFIWPNTSDEETMAGLWIGSLRDAKRRFKGSAPNDLEAGKKIRLTLRETAAMGEGPEASPFVVVPPEEAARLKARSGDLVYVADRRWWLGGLRSLHARLEVAPGVEGEIGIPSDHVEYSGLRTGEEVVLEKIL